MMCNAHRSVALAIFPLLVAALAACGPKEQDDGRLHLRITVPDGYQGPVVVWYPVQDSTARPNQTQTRKLPLPPNGFIWIPDTLPRNGLLVHLMRKSGEEIKWGSINCTKLQTFTQGQPTLVIACAPIFFQVSSRHMKDPTFEEQAFVVLIADSAHVERAHNAGWELLRAEGRYEWMDSTDRWEAPRARP